MTGGGGTPGTAVPRGREQEACAAQPGDHGAAGGTGGRGRARPSGKGEIQNGATPAWPVPVSLERASASAQTLVPGKCHFPGLPPPSPSPPCLWRIKALRGPGERGRGTAELQDSVARASQRQCSERGLAIPSMAPMGSSAQSSPAGQGFSGGTLQDADVPCPGTGH